MDSAMDSSMIRRSVLLPALLAIGGCGEPAPPLAVGDVNVFAPLPGSTMGAAYMTITNNTGDTIVIGRVASPQFGQVELHETRLSDGVARMRELPALPVPARSSVALAEGGVHLMLMRPVDKLEIGQPITLRVHYDSDGVVIVTSNLKSRLDGTR